MPTLLDIASSHQSRTEKQKWKKFTHEHLDGASFFPIAKLFS